MASIPFMRIGASFGQICSYIGGFRDVEQDVFFFQTLVRNPDIKRYNLAHIFSGRHKKMSPLETAQRQGDFRVDIWRLGPAGSGVEPGWYVDGCYRGLMSGKDADDFLRKATDRRLKPGSQNGVYYQVRIFRQSFQT